jgi:hypothetical protein
VVVAYLGTGADRLLKLKDGDRLVVDMSLATVKGGQTNPSEVVKYLRHGVQVFNCTNLHAKVYVYDNAAIIGSANVSRHSAEDLVEAGLLCTDQQAVSQARGFVRSLQVEPISLKYARKCQGLYNPPSRGAGRQKRRKRSVTPTHSRLWLVGVSPVEFSGMEDALCEKEEQRAAKKLKSGRRYEVKSIRWIGRRSRFTKEVKQGDLLVQIWNEGRKARVYPPSRVLRITHYRSFDRTRKPRMFVHVEEEKHPKTVDFKRFVKVAKPVGLTRLNSYSEREVQPAEAVHAILGLWR